MRFLNWVGFITCSLSAISSFFIQAYWGNTLFTDNPDYARASYELLQMVLFGVGAFLFSYLLFGKEEK